MDADAIVILEMSEKKTQKTPKPIIDICRKRLSHYEEAKRHWKKGEC